MPAPLRARFLALLDGHVQDLLRCEEIQAIERGRATREEIDRFIEGVIRSHLRSPKLLAFVYALAPPGEATKNLLHNMLEELGLDADEGGVAHPDLLIFLARGAGLESRLPALEAEADEELRRYVVDPLLHGTLRDVGLSALAEIVSFEYMLSRVSSRIARALGVHRGLSPDALQWFTHHAEVDLAHAEQGLDEVVHFATHYGLSDDDAMTLLEMALRENAFVKRYFGTEALARLRRLSP